MKSDRLFRVVSLMTALVWATAGIAKIVERIPWVGGADSGEVWSDRFPVWVVMLIAILEMCLGFILIARPSVVIVGIGIVLSTGFLVAAMLFPADPGATCGCFGGIIDLSGSDLVAHLVFWIGWHTALLALAQPRMSRR